MSTMRIFSNWPTSQTPLHYVNTFDFSAKSEYLALGNDRGHVLLYKLNHFVNTQE
jgi:U3 small nucleolar RNA-associated protein 18